MPSSDIPSMLFKGETTKTEQMSWNEKPSLCPEQMSGKIFFEPKKGNNFKKHLHWWGERSRRPSVRVSVILMLSCLGSCCEEKPLTAISRTDQSQLCVAWWAGLILNNRLSAVPIFLASLAFPCLGFRAPATTFRSLTNSRVKIGTARSLGDSQNTKCNP